MTGGFFPSYPVAFAEYSPLSQGAEALPAPSGPVFNFLALFVVSLVLLVVWVVSYRHVFTRLRESGRI